jgi:hypothetical protein
MIASIFGVDIRFGSRHYAQIIRFFYSFVRPRNQETKTLQRQQNKPCTRA